MAIEGAARTEKYNDNRHTFREVREPRENIGIMRTKCRNMRNCSSGRSN